MIDLLHAHVIPAALSVLPPKMNSRGARAMLLAIAMQESRGQFRRQIGGPARSFWMFEVGGLLGVLHHARTKDLAAAVLLELCYPTVGTRAQAIACQSVLEHNDILAGCFARLLLYTLPDPLPGPDDPDPAWRQYRAAWNPGKPHRATWDGFYASAWTLVDRPSTLDVGGHQITGP